MGQDETFDWQQRESVMLHRADHSKHALASLSVSQDETEHTVQHSTTENMNDKKAITSAVVTARRTLVECSRSHSFLYIL